jgi:predicted TIM-barrel fold metal-dependent hydrolase
MKNIDLTDYPVVDDHCHPFLTSTEPKGVLGRSSSVSPAEAFAENFNFSGMVVPAKQSEDLVLYRRTMSQLARFLGCSKTNFQEIVSIRNEKYHKEPKEYMSGLFRDARIDCLLLDTGFPSEEFTSYSVDMAEFQRVLPCKSKRIFRVERPMYLLFQDRDLTFDDMLKKYDDSLQSAITHDGYIGFKSVIAYGFGLDIQDRAIQDARHAYNSLKEDGRLALPLKEKYRTDLREEKVLRDFLVYRGIEKSAQLDVPFTFHTGLGSSPVINAGKCNPLLLYNPLQDDKLQKARIVLVHGGMTYTEEAGYLANQFANVYIDMSCMMPFTYPALTNKLVELFEMTPTTKLLYGSDGYVIPELFWISAILGKEALSKVLEQMVSSNAIDEDYAYEIAARILHENAEHLWKL